MCGIAGRLNFRTGRPADERIVSRMADLIAHRGPDGFGVYADGPLGLGHRRLAVIDLSDAGRQPMASRDGRAHLVFNGEIYNFLELRRDLEARGHSFQSHTDTEVILAAWREFGVECLQRLRGMFAFALWDAPTRTLLLARDRLGKKPLHYYLDADGLAFASEPKAFLADPSFRPVANPEAIWHYLSLQSVPSPLSAFAGVSKLPPAHYLLVKDGDILVKRYWRLRYEPKLVLSEDEAAERLRILLSEAVRLRMISDVPLGAFLSGGIDSGTVVALMAQHSDRPVRTFSIGFDEEVHDEVAYARLVATRYDTHHQEFVVRPDAVAVIPKLAWHYNEPYADPSAVPTYYLSELTRRYVTVALNGDGGDENFAGYDRYVPGGAARTASRLPRGVGDLLRRVSAGAPRSGSANAPAERIRRWLEVNGRPADERYAILGMQFRPGLKADLCTPDFVAGAGGRPTEDLLLERLQDSDAAGLLDRMLDMDVSGYLPDTLLVKVDIASMAHGLETRSPLLDHEVAEFAARLPEAMKLNGSVKKRLLKRVAAPLLPAEVIGRPKKGFSLPIEQWLRGPLREYAADLLLSRRAIDRGYFRENIVRQLLDQHARGERPWHDQIWNLIMLEAWHRACLDATHAHASPPTPNVEAVTVPAAIRTTDRAETIERGKERILG